MQRDVLLTGATGFLGMELLARYLERTDRTIIALVRARGPEEAQVRIAKALELMFGDSDRHHVADAIVHLAGTEQQGGLCTYHVVAGERAATVAQLVELSARRLGRRPPPVVPPTVYRAAYPLLLACAGRRRRAALKRVAPFLPYYTMRVRYRRDRAAGTLDPVGLRPPPLESYYHRLVDYALATNWSRKPLPRPDAVGDASLAAINR
jgi:nucleoside-diphosphate-sugar epimerase